MGRWRDWLGVLSDAVTVATGLTLLAASVGYAVGRLSRTGAVVILIGLAAIFGVLVYVRRRAWWKAIRPKYVSGVVWLAGPVREDVEVRLRPGAAGRALGDAAVRLPGLPTNALRVLQFALAGSHRYSGGPCWVGASQVFSIRGRAEMDAFAKLNDGCNALVTSGMVSTYKLKPTEGGAQVWLERDIEESDETGEVSHLVREELGRRRA